MNVNCHVHFRKVGRCWVESTKFPRRVITSVSIRLILDLLQFAEEMMARFMLLLMFVVIVVQKCCNNRVDRVLKSVSYVLTVRILFSFTRFL